MARKLAAEIVKSLNTGDNTMRKYRLVWSPEGREIARVEAISKRAAIRKAPQPYRCYLGEIYAEEV